MGSIDCPETSVIKFNGQGIVWPSKIKPTDCPKMSVIKFNCQGTACLFKMGTTNFPDTSVIDFNGQKTVKPSKIKPIDCVETSVTNYQYTLRNIPEEQISHLMFFWSCIIVCQYNETNVMHFSFNLLRMKGLCFILIQMDVQYSYFLKNF
jgi:UDP-glucose 4-epimerase